METTINHRVSILFFLLYALAILILGGNLAWTDYNNFERNKKERIAEMRFKIENLEMDKIFNMRPAEVLDREIKEYKQQIEKYGNYTFNKYNDFRMGRIRGN